MSVYLQRCKTAIGENNYRKFGVMSIPYIVLYENGEVKRSNLGFMMKEDLKKLKTLYYMKN